METAPMPLDALAEAHGGLDEFRVSAPSEVLGYLRQLCAGNAILTLVSPSGENGSATIWAIDGDRDSLTLSSAHSGPGLEALARDGVVTAVGYLDNIKVQFELAGLVPSRQGAVSARMPRLLYRFQRRNAYRVKPLPRTAPSAHLRHPDALDLPMQMRVLDLSIGGCSLLARPGKARLEPGMVLENVHIDLDGHSTMRCSLMLRHVTRVDSDTGEEAGGIRLGCELLNLSPDSERELQRFIDQMQRKRGMLAL